MTDYALDYNHHRYNGIGYSTTEFWLFADGVPVAFAAVGTRESEDFDVLCDIESRFHRMGHGSELVSRIKEFTGRPLKITGCCTPNGQAFLTALGVEQTDTGVEDYGVMGADGYRGSIPPMKFVDDWDTQSPRHPV